MPKESVGSVAGQGIVAWEQFFQTLGQSVSDSAFWVGFVLVAVFAYSRFAISKDSSDEIDPPLVARSFTTRFRYYMGASTYVGLYEFLFVMLVGLGSFQFLQDLLTKWIGSLEVPGEKNLAIGTPAWAALVVTSLMPSAPGFSTLDRQARDFLHRFSSIPVKARALAQEIISEAAKLESNKDDGRKLLSQLSWLREAVELLQDGTKNPLKSAQYSKFFGTYREAYNRAIKKEKKFLETLEAGAESTPFMINELRDMVNHMARFLSCALLMIEPTEHQVRDKIRRQLNLKSLPELTFGFSLKQILIGIFITTVLTFIAGLASLWMVLAITTSINNPSVESVVFVVKWIPYSALILVPPFIIAAGVQLYFLDRKQLDDIEIPWEDKVVATIGLFIGTFGVGILAPLAGKATYGRIEGYDWLLQVLPYGLVPAMLAITFSVVATHCPTQSRAKNAALDFFVFALIAGLTVWFATWVATRFGLNIAEVSNSYEFNNKIAIKVFPLTAAVLAGAMGVIQCAISRHLIKEHALATESC